MPFVIFRGDHLRSTSGIICGPIWGSFPVWGSFAALYRCKIIENWENKKKFRTCAVKSRPCCHATNAAILDPRTQINQSARCISSTRNKCFCGKSWSCKVKNGKHRRKLASKQRCATSWGFLYLVFRRPSCGHKQKSKAVRGYHFYKYVWKPAIG